MPPAPAENDEELLLVLASELLSSDAEPENTRVPFTNGVEAATVIGGSSPPAGTTAELTHERYQSLRYTLPLFQPDPDATAPWNGGLSVTVTSPDDGDVP